MDGSIHEAGLRFRDAAAFLPQTGDADSRTWNVRRADPGRPPRSPTPEGGGGEQGRTCPRGADTSTIGLSERRRSGVAPEQNRSLTVAARGTRTHWVGRTTIVCCCLLKRTRDESARQRARGRGPTSTLRGPLRIGGAAGHVATRRALIKPGVATPIGLHLFAGRRSRSRRTPRMCGPPYIGRDVTLVRTNVSLKRDLNGVRCWVFSG